METTINKCDHKDRCECKCGKEHENTYTHVHELLGSVRIVNDECGRKCHNHRFATVSGKAEYRQGTKGHVHKVEFKTDTFDAHNHEFCGFTGPAIDVGFNRHIHLIYDETTHDDHHKHRFIAGTLIENPTGHEK